MKSEAENQALCKTTAELINRARKERHISRDDLWLLLQYPALSSVRHSTTAELKALLLDDNASVRRITRFTIAISILYELMPGIATEMVTCELSGENAFLNLVRCDLRTWDNERMTVFAYALKNSQLTSLCLCWNDRDTWDIARVTAFADALKDSQLTSLCLAHSHLGTWDSARVTVFADALKKSQLTSLNLCYNDLGDWDSARVTAFADALKDSQLTSLDLKGNVLGRWDIARVTIFADALKDSQLAWLNLSGAHLSIWGENDNRWQIITDAILKNPSIREIKGLPGNTPPALIAALARNVVCDKLQQFELIDGEADIAFDERCEALAEEALAQLSQWRKRDEPDAKSKECRFLEQAIAVFLTKLFDKKRYRFDELLQLCSADTAFVRDLYFEYIQNSYLTDNNQLDVTNKFAAAIPFLIDGTAAPVIFDNEQQRALDSFLQTSVCKIDVTLAQHQQCLDITTRATLLRRLLLQLIQVELETSASVSATNTLAQTAVGLLDVISALLLRFLLLLIQAQLETSVLVSATITQAQMAADLLDKISAVLACSIAVPPTTEQQNQHAQCLQEVYEKLSSVDAEILKKPLIQQLSLLVQYTEDVLQKTTVFKELCNEKEQQQTWTIEAIKMIRWVFQ